MDDRIAIESLNALAQETRLAAFRLLAIHEPNGMAAGELAGLLNVPQNTLSSHLGILVRQGLVSGFRHSRSVIYRAHPGRLQEILLFLLKDCCGGQPQLCTPDPQASPTCNNDRTSAA